MFVPRLSKTFVFVFPKVFLLCAFIHFSMFYAVIYVNGGRIKSCLFIPCPLFTNLITNTHASILMFLKTAVFC